MCVGINVKYIEIICKGIVLDHSTLPGTKLKCPNGNNAKQQHNVRHKISKVVVFIMPRCTLVTDREIWMLHLNIGT